MSIPRWEHFAHGSDIGVRGIGRTLEQAFEQAALALTAVVADISAIVPAEKQGVHCEAPDREILLASWLNAIIYEMAVNTMLFSEFHVNISEAGIFSLTASIAGEPVDPERHQVCVEAKGATMTALSVKQDAVGQWVAQCVVDV